MLIVEDIVDTGKSAVALIAALQEFKPNSVRFASLLIKKTPLSNGYKPDCSSANKYSTNPMVFVQMLDLPSQTSLWSATASTTTSTSATCSTSASSASRAASSMPSSHFIVYQEENDVSFVRHFCF